MGRLTYKARWKNKITLAVPRFFPSSKLCSNCWWKKTDLDLSDRIFKCDRCGLEIDRDLNAAINMEIYGFMYLINPLVADSWNETLNACGGDMRPIDILSGLLPDAINDKRSPDEARRFPLQGSGVKIWSSDNDE